MIFPSKKEGGVKLNSTYPMSAKAHSSWFKESNKSPI